MENKKKAGKGVFFSVSFFTYKSISQGFILLSFLIYLISLWVVKHDTSFDYRWQVFWLHHFSIALVVAPLIFKNRAKIKLFLARKELFYLTIIISLAFVLNTLFTNKYPFVSIGDELRDGGLFAVKIASGEIKNIFAYGSYNAHGLIIPSLVSFLYPVLGSSVLLYRLSAAFLLSLDVFLVYLILRFLVDRLTGLWAALILATFPLHLFFARTQVVTAFNFFWSAFILAILAIKKETFQYLIVTGAILGYISGFHAAIRSLACLVFLMILVPLMVKKRVWGLVLLIVFFFVGFGPRLLFTGPKTFFHIERFFLKENIEKKSSLELVEVTKLKNNYLKSLKVWFNEPAQFFYPDHKPLLRPILAILFLYGIGYSLIVFKDSFYRRLLIILLCLPFLNSAITDRINADHRLSPLLPIGAVFIAIGFIRILGFIKFNWGRRLISGFFLVYLTLPVVSFYLLRPADKPYGLKDYLSMHAYYFLQSEQKKVRSGEYCLLVSPPNINDNYEQVNFFLPAVKINWRADNSIKENQIYIVKGQCPNSTPFLAPSLTISCLQPKYECPLDYAGEIKLYYSPQVSRTE